MTITRNPREAALERVAEAVRRIINHGSPFDFEKLVYAIQDLDALPAADGGWRPINTAPSDGSTILVYGGRFREATPHTADGEWWAYMRKTGTLSNLPTHWQPLPPPPVPQSADE